MVNRGLRGTRSVCKRLGYVVLCWGSLAIGALEEGPFDLNTLPVGKDVTINRPATTNIPLEARVRLTATDSPQTLSFTVVAPPQLAQHGVKVAIYDAQSSAVRYLNVKPAQAALYSFKGLSTIFVVPSRGEGGGAGGGLSQVRLQVASDKPLTIAH